MKKLGEVTTEIVELLSPFEAAEQQKIVAAALMLLGNTAIHVSPAENRSVQQAGRPEGTINVVTAKLGSGSCREILIAAAVHLSIFQGKSKWSRREWASLCAESRDWKSNYAPQVTRDIGRLIKGADFIENSKNTFSLSSKALKKFEAEFQI